jgi:predicted outer membrane repeat protein
MRSRIRARLLVRGLEERAVPATFTVTNNFDAGPGSFRQAILDSNAAPGADVILFDAAAFATSQTITLNTALPEIEDDVDIIGTGSGKVRIERSDFAASTFRVLTVDQGSRQLVVNISGLTLAKGNLVVTPNAKNPSLTQVINGGGLYIADESVTLTDVVITQNVSNQQGGGVAAGPGGILTIVNSTISNNTATGAVGGISILGQSFSGVGGGIYFTYDGSLTVISSSVTGNVAKNRGGGIYLYGETYGKAVIRNSTIANNSTQQSSILRTSGGAGISVNTNSSLSSASFNLTIQNSTITANTTGGSGSGGGLLLTGKSPARIESTIISGNSASIGPDISSPATNKVTVDFSALGSSNNGFTLTAGPGGATSNKIGQNLQLTLSGGLYIPATTSPVIDAGSNPAGLSTDQRGLSRYYDEPTVVGNSSNVDIGAVEAQPAGLPVAVATAPNVLTAGGGSATVTVTYTDNTAINVATLGTGDIKVTGPGSFSATPTFVSVTPSGNGSPRVATYTFTPPGGTWDLADIGSYSIVLQAGQVADTSGNAVPAGVIGSFSVALPRTLVVTNTNDSGPGSLRQAILDANAISPSHDTITFSAAILAVPSFITMSAANGQMKVTDSVTIVGAAVPQFLTLDANFTSRHFIIDGAGPLQVNISGMTLTNGRTTNNFFSERGGSINLGDDSLTLTNMIFSGNGASKSYGGAIYVGGGGTVAATNCRFTGNSATALTGGGGAIASLEPGHTISLVGCVVSGNNGGLYGGGVFSTNGGTVTVERSTFASNQTTQTITIEDENSAAVYGGGAIAVGGQITADQLPRAATLRITDSTFANNTSPRFGGAILFAAPSPAGSWIRNSTLAFNSVNTTTDGLGGAILVGGLLDVSPFHIDNSTVAFNSAYSGGGIFVGNNETNVYLRSSIVAANINGDPQQLPIDIDGQLHALYSLIGSLDGAGLLTDIGNLTGNPAVPLDPMLSPTLTNNGGPTDTLALMPGSPALDAGDNVNAATFDQRGVGFPRISNGQTDIGAFELQVVSAPTVTSVVVNDGSAQRSTVRSITVTFSDLVTLAPGAFDLQRTGPGGPTGAVSVSVDTSGSTATQTVAKLTFTGSLTEGGGSLIDGRYSFTVVASGVTGTASSLPMAADNVTSLHRLFGDADGDATVTVGDFLSFRLNFLGSNPAFDFDGNGSINAADFLQFRLRFLQTIP